MALLTRQDRSAARKSERKRSSSGSGSECTESAARSDSFAQVDGVMAEVRLAIGDQDLVSIITRSSVERMGLKVGDQVFAVINPPR